MWQDHFTVLGVLVALAIPVYLLDHWLLKPSGDVFLINLRGILIAGYVAWLVVHVPLSSAALWWLKTDRLFALHGIVALLSIGIVFAAMKIHDRVESAQARAEREARAKVRAVLADALTLEKWWYVPDASKPQRIGAVLHSKHSGRLAVRVQARGRSGFIAYSGQMRPQKQVAAGERVEVVLPLEHYRDEPAPDVQFTLMLFRDQTGSAPEDIYKEYGANLVEGDDGQHFVAPLPAAAEGP